jgi:hypothetical protein
MPYLVFVRGWVDGAAGSIAISLADGVLPSQDLTFGGNAQ